LQTCPNTSPNGLRSAGAPRTRCSRGRASSRAGHCTAQKGSDLLRMRSTLGECGPCTLAMCSLRASGRVLALVETPQRCQPHPCPHTRADPSRHDCLFYDSELMPTPMLNAAYRYIEHGVKRNALVKIRVCPNCASKLNAHVHREEVPDHTPSVEVVPSSSSSKSKRKKGRHKLSSKKTKARRTAEISPADGRRVE
jgi:hypothetical protein